jgi:4-hydroxy-tetrahydrodipicolinate reductase
MGSLIASMAAADKRFSVPARVKNRDFDLLQKNLGKVDVLIDFSVPEASLRYANLAAAARKPIVIGTTGFSAADWKALRELAQKTPLFHSPNFSLGIHVMLSLAEEAARSLPDFDASISETHHKQKKDAPSGTALRIAERLSQARPGGPPIEITSRRLGHVVGEHVLTLAGPFETLEITHRAQSREVFAAGALEAALWLKARKPGLYGMDDLR